MKIIAFICNIVLVMFTLMVLVTDGPSNEAVYIVFALLLLLVPILNSVMIILSGMNQGKQGSQIILFSTPQFMKITLFISNIVLLGLSCWAFVSQYPHPREDGFIIYVLFVFLTPILSLFVIFHSYRVKIKHTGLN